MPQRTAFNLRPQYQQRDCDSALTRTGARAGARRRGAIGALLAKQISRHLSRCRGGPR